MGVLYQASTIKKNLKHQMVLERLEELNYKESQAGKSIYDMDYKELLVELVLAEMRQVDIEHPDHKWFR